jgi:hypothetical protein
VSDEFINPYCAANSTVGYMFGQSQPMARRSSHLRSQKCSATLALPLDSGVNRKILHDPRRLLTPGIRTLDRLLALGDQQELRLRLHADAGLHALRRTFLTEAGEYYASTEPFTLQYVAGDDNIKTTTRHVHPREVAVHKLFARLADLQRPEEAQRVQQVGEIR